MSFDGYDEQAHILSSDGLGSLLGGRVWEIEVPPKVKLPEEKGEVLPYVIVNFGSPIAFAPGGRSDKTFASTEQDQAHLMSITVLVHAGSVASLKAATKTVIRKLVGMVPNKNGRGNEISAQGGPTLVERDDQGKTTRLTRVIVAQLVVS